MDRRRWIVALTLASMAAYGLALVLPAIATGADGDPATGFVCLTQGTVLPVYWGANPLLWLGWILLLYKNPTAKIFTLLAFTSCLAFMADSFKNYGGRELFIGSWFWLGSILIADFAAVLTLLQRRARRLATTR